MCRSIKRLRQPAGIDPTQDEVEQAARQFVRKISGIQHPSSRTEDAFQRAIDEISVIAAQLLQDLPPLQRPRRQSTPEEITR
ncbi:MAG: DUF2277 domain-containing protein [Chloroflexota bacterium]|nr:DUF2277 domain-containing protein [Chloroflexota bacterium]